MSLNFKATIQLTAVILACLVSLDALAHATVTVGGLAFPASSDLRSLFPAVVYDQGNEGTCHIYASVALAESYCNRLLEENGSNSDIHLSEEYFKYRRLRSALHDLDTTGAFKHDALLSVDVDADFPESTLKRIFDGSVLTENEFPTNRELEGVLAKLKHGKSALKSPAEFAAANSILDNYFAKRIAKAHLTAKPSSGGGAYATSMDPSMTRCLVAKPEIRNEVFNVEKAVSLLAHGTPFIWFGHWTFRGGSSGNHAIVVDGYRFNPHLKVRVFPYQIEFHIRNSSETQDSWGTHIKSGFGQIVYLSDQELTLLPDELPSGT